MAGTKTIDSHDGGYFLALNLLEIRGFYNLTFHDNLILKPTHLYSHPFRYKRWAEITNYNMECYTYSQLNTANPASQQMLVKYYNLRVTDSVGR